MARERGVAVDEAAAHALAAKALAHIPDISSIDATVQYHAIIDPGAMEGWELVAADAAGVKPSLTTAVLARRILNMQRPDGRWITTDQRPPLSNSAFTATAVAVRGLLLYAPEELRKDAAASAVRAKEWLLKAKPATTEDFTYRLLGLAWAGAGAQEKAAAARELRALQRPDGGFGQLPRMASDAYATGEAVMALYESAGVMKMADPTTQKAVAFLLSTQAADGSWHVATRMVSPAKVSPPFVETGFPYGKDQVISAAGTALATMALLEMLPRVEHPPAPQPLPELAPKGEEPWMRTALLGTAIELKNLLDHGLDANSRSAAGTTLLMMASADPAKIRLLLDRGADVKAKAKSGFTALMVASTWRGAAESLKLLLAKGAETAPGTGVIFNASPLALATMTGDLDNMKLLLAKGADPNRKMMLLGMFPASPLFSTLNPAEPAVIQTLAAAGANLKERDDQGMTALDWAALANNIPAAKALIAAGAGLNETDKAGYTPLLYAATVDFGGSDMVKTLLEAGADRKIKNKEGKTALDQARRYGFPEIEAALK